MFELGLWPANFIAQKVAGQRPCSNIVLNLVYVNLRMLV